MEKFLLEPTGYKGYHLMRLNEDGTISRGNNTYTVEEYRQIAQIEYKVITKEDLQQHIIKYRMYGDEPLEELPEEEFDFYLDVCRTYRPYAGKSLSYFFVDHPETEGSYLLVVSYQGKYYSATRPIDMEDREIIQEIHRIPFIDPCWGYGVYSLEELIELDIEYDELHRYNFGSSRFDKSINDISRAIIIKFTERHGKGYLGMMNIPKAFPLKDFKLVEYRGQKIYNSVYDFIIPVNDPELTKCIIAHQFIIRPDNTFSCKGGVEYINNRIKALGGLFLTWS